MKLLGLDVGAKRIGLAICDEKMGVVFPRGTIERKNLKQTLSDLKIFCEKEGISKIVCGLPVDEQERERKSTASVRKFGEMLQKETGIKIEFIDESFSTDEAIALMPKFRKEFKDELSAVIILERYLKERI